MSETDKDGLPEAPEPAVRPSLDDVISASFEKVEAARETEAAQARTEDGKFAPKTEAASPATEQPAEPPIEPPARWSEAEKAEFAQLDRRAQKIVVDRYKAMEADYTRKAQEAAETRKKAAPYVEALSPHDAYLAQIASQVGTTPTALLSDLLVTEKALRLGTPHEKAVAAQRVLAAYGIDPRALATGQIAPAAPADPYFQQLSTTIAPLAQKVERFDQFIAQLEEREVQSTVAAFQNAKNEDGSPKHPHFEQVREYMGYLMQTQKAETLEQAYEIAAKPINEALSRVASAKAPVSDPASVQKALKAAPVKTSGTLPKGTTQPKGLDALISRNLESAGFQ